jgi:hypothetical protein
MMRANTIAGYARHTVTAVDTDAYRSLYLSRGNRGKDFREDGTDFFGKFFLCLLPFAWPDIVNAFPERAGRIEMGVVLLQEAFHVQWVSHAMRDFHGPGRR